MVHSLLVEVTFAEPFVYFKVLPVAYVNPAEKVNEGDEAPPISSIPPLFIVTAPVKFAVADDTALNFKVPVTLVVPLTEILLPAAIVKVAPEFTTNPPKDIAATDVVVTVPPKVKVPPYVALELIT